MPSNNPCPGDKRQHDLRSTLTKRQILDGARQVFLLNGYAGASIDQIISQSGVSKGSIYHHFDSKDALFRSLIAAEAERIARALPPIDQDDPDPNSALRQIGIAILETLNNPATIATLRLIIGALGRDPGLGEEFLRNSLGQTVERIAADLDVRAAAGNLRIGNSRAAAEEFARRCLAHDGACSGAPSTLPDGRGMHGRGRGYSSKLRHPVAAGYRPAWRESRSHDPL
jgi:TetR/AcrR family transcriptional regulator, mexJK operon transcriptional repressor